MRFLVAPLLLFLGIGLSRPASAQFLEKAEFEGGVERAATDGPRRQWDHPTYCQLVIDLKVSRAGKVLSAAVNVPLSTCSDPALVAEANALARTYVFTPNAKAPEPQAARFTWGIGQRPQHEDLFANDPVAEMLPSPPAEAESERTWMVVEVPPQFPGGPAAMNKYVQMNLVYPEDAMAAEIEGVVLISFIVEKDGKLSTFTLEKGVHTSLNQEAMRVMLRMPNWNPGLQNGRQVRTRCEVPITFRIP